MTDQVDVPFWEAMELPAPNTHMTLSEYDMLPETTLHVEFHGGVVIYPNWSEATMSPAPSTKHQRLTLKSATVLEDLASNGVVVIAPTDVLLDGRKIQPDVFWIAAGGAGVDRETHYEGPPDLIIEVVSPASIKHDRVTKFDLYERNGVSEYWIIDPLADYLEAYTLRDGKYVRVNQDANGDFHSPSLDKQVVVGRIFGNQPA